MKFIARRFLTLLAAVVVGALFGGLTTGLFMGGWVEGMILGGCGGALLGMLYDPRAATYTVPTRGGGTYPGDRDD
jgi:mannose/fructose/N-acetylgalactosamine-specific phosphotransferase system component IIC